MQVDSWIATQQLITYSKIKMKLANWTTWTYLSEHVSLFFYFRRHSAFLIVQGFV